jgi:FPC/CPF motif-containing protein YcgG
MREALSRADFPCLGAKAALAKGKLSTYTARRPLTEDAEPLAERLRAFVEQYSDPRSDFAAVVALDPCVVVSDEHRFESYLWDVLAALHQIDQHPWDSRYSRDPRSADFKFSFAGRAWYVVGLSPVASRIARRVPVAGLVFNPVWQFERLRDVGQLDGLIEKVRRRDTRLQGNISPNLRFEGTHSDALQYSGREVASTWQCPFPRS